MRHARKAAARVMITMLLCAMLNASVAAVAHAIDSPGGTPALTALTTSSTGSAGAGGTGGSASATASNTGGSGGAVAPSTKGTGGSEYGVLTPRPKVAHKPASRKSSRSARRPAPKPKRKPKSKSNSKPKPKPAVPAPSAASEAGVPTPAQTASEGAVFPVLGPHGFGDAENRFGAPRAGYTHQGQDVLASEGLTVVAPLAGTIITTAYQAGGAGWYAAEHTVDGLDFFYAHCQAGSLAVSAGQAVGAGQAVCKVGQTGDAIGPHLHFEVWVGGWQAAGGHAIDPLPYLEEWDHAAGG